jgi:pyruvate kinase
MMCGTIGELPNMWQDIRALPGVKESNFKIIAKIENREGIDNFDEILAETDGVMVARGDMGVEISLPEVTTVQKQMIAKCNVAGKPVITATQMLESMIQNPRPTRAEVADVFNAVIDGTDCVMLSGETAMGGFPVESVKIMGEICIEAEAQINYRELFLKLREMTAKVPKFNVPESVTSSAVKTSWDLQACTYQTSICECVTNKFINSIDRRFVCLGQHCTIGVQVQTSLADCLHHRLATSRTTVAR